MMRQNRDVTEALTRRSSPGHEVAQRKPRPAPICDYRIRDALRRIILEAVHAIHT